MENSFPEFGNGNNAIPSEWEADIPGSGREREFLLTPGVNGWAVTDTHLLVNGTMRICIPPRNDSGIKSGFSEFAEWISHDPLDAEFTQNPIKISVVHQYDF